MDATTAPIVYPDSAVTLALAFCIAFIIVGTLGNLATVWALLTHKGLRNTVTSTFIVSLSVTDLIFCVFNLPIIATRYANRAWVLPDVFCRLFPFFFYLNVAASLFCMTAITINRFVLIAHYHIYDKVYRRSHIAVMIALCWLLPFILLLPTLIEVWGRFGYAPRTFSCTILRGDDGESPKKFFFLIGFFAPCAVILGCYARIFFVVRASRLNMASHNSNGGRKRSRAQTDEMALTKMVVVIFAAFVACYLPLMAVNVFDDHYSMPWAHVLASVLAWSASVLNPFVYGFMSARYRQAYLSILPCVASRLLGSRSPTASSGTRNSGSVILLHSTAFQLKMTDSLTIDKDSHVKI